MIARLKVILESIVTWAMVLVVAATAVAEAFPTFAQWMVTVVAVLTGIVFVIRRVTPVLPAERGLLPTDDAPGG